MLPDLIFSCQINVKLEMDSYKHGKIYLNRTIGTVFFKRQYFDIRFWRDSKFVNPRTRTIEYFMCFYEQSCFHFSQILAELYRLQEPRIYKTCQNEPPEALTGDPACEIYVCPLFHFKPLLGCCLAFVA